MNLAQQNLTNPRSLVLSALASLFLASTASLLLSAEKHSDFSGHALLIGIEDYKRATKLPFVANDVRQLRETLEDRGGYGVTLVVNSALPDAAAGPGQVSESQALRQKIKEWLSDRVATETALLYFSGHGFRDEEGFLYLAGIDCDPVEPEPGGIPVHWLRDELLQCQAKSKILILDACHAGSAKGHAAPRVASAKDINAVFEQLEGVVTLASCIGAENSFPWPEKNVSLFTYWLVQALKGHADSFGNRDGEVTVNELDTYVTQKVKQTAAKLSIQQTPTRLQGEVVHQLVLRIQPYELKELIDEMAEQVDVAIRINNLSAVGIVPEFVCHTQEGKFRGIEYGIAPAQIADELAERLIGRSAKAYEVYDTEVMREVLMGKGIGPQEVRTKMSKGIEIENKPLAAIVTGEVGSRVQNRLQVNSKLSGRKLTATYGTAGGVAFLNEDEIAMMGMSFVGLEDQGESAPDFFQEVTPAAEALAERIERTSEDPLEFHSDLYGVEIRVKEQRRSAGWERRALRFSGKHHLVHLKPGDVYYIGLQNRSDNLVFARVLVDGLNTLPEKRHIKGVQIEARNDGAEMIQAARVNLAEARAWALYPASDDNPKGTYAVKGFYSSVPTKDHGEGEYHAFKVVDAPDSAAAKRGFTEQLGLITVAFYKPVTKTTRAAQARAGTGFGRRYNEQMEVYKGNKMPGDLLGAINIRYGGP